MPSSITWYRFKFRNDRAHGLHQRSSLLLINYILPKDGLMWLCRDTNLFSQWVACISGDGVQAGAIGDIVKQADHESVARNLGATPLRQTQNSNAKPLHEKLVTGLRYLLNKGELPLNRNGAAGWLVGDDLWLVSKRAIDALRAHLLREGHSGIPNRNDRIFDELQQRGILIPWNDRAIWHCIVKGDDWQHELTLIRLPVVNIWPDPDLRPEPFLGEIFPVESQGTIDNIHTEPVSSQSNVDRTELDNDKSGFELPEMLEASEDGGVHSVEFNNRVGSNRNLPLKAGESESTAKDELCQQFLAWLRDNIRTGELVPDIPGSRIHNIPEGLFLVSPAIFKDFVDRTGSELSWDHVQKRFLKLGIHTKTSDGLKIHKRSINGVSLHGIVLSDFGI